MKINLKQVIVSVSGEPLTKEEPKAGTRTKILREILALKNVDADSMKETLLRWQKELVETEEKKMTVKDYFLTLLSQRFELKDTKKRAFGLRILVLLVPKMIY